MQITSHARRRAVTHLRAADPVLARIIEEVGPCRLKADLETTPFAALVESIVYQQITGKAAATIHGRLRALVGEEIPQPRHIVAASDEALRGVGLSRQKISYLRDLATKAESGLIPDDVHTLDDEAVIERLTAVRGVGRWTAEMFLMFRLGRRDVLPVDDYGIRKAMQRAYRMRKLPKPDRMFRVAERWRPYRSVACWYLWRSLDTTGGRA
jgi:3-methyladenine DNA glycosylase/8-oxoguanine DNA glycosylase